MKTVYKWVMFMDEATSHINGCISAEFEDQGNQFGNAVQYFNTKCDSTILTFLKSGKPFFHHITLVPEF
jgi:hypothetical protein